MGRRLALINWAWQVLFSLYDGVVAELAGLRIILVFITACTSKTRRYSTRQGGIARAGIVVIQARYAMDDTVSLSV